MGVIWVQTSNNKMLHLPIIGPDINTPDSLPKVPASSIPIEELRSGVISPVFVEGYGIILFNFTAPGRTGSCVQCGSCCTHPVENCPGQCTYIYDEQYNVHKCQYLIINPGEGKLGEPGQAACSLYSNVIEACKGCLFGPGSIREMMPWMKKCGFKFKE